MGIRLKIALGFVLLTIAVIALVSFWGAQSLGFTVDSSDLIRLESIKENIEKQLNTQRELLDKQIAEACKAIDVIGLDSLINSNQLTDFIEKLKENLDCDYGEIFRNEKPLSELNQLKKLPNTSDLITRLSGSGPLSHSGYLVAGAFINEKGQEKFIIATKPKLQLSETDVFCIFDDRGIVASKGFVSQYSLAELQELTNNSSTKQTKVGSELYRLRAFQISGGLNIIIGYSAQVATLARSEINSMMMQLSILEIIGFLILGYFWAKKIFAPMKTLQESIEKVSEGKWQTIPPEITENSYEEIAAVAKSFNQMVNQLSNAKETLIETQKKLAIKDKMASLGRFSAGIAHEINNPLGTILMSAGMIKDSLEKGISIEEEDISTIIEEVKRCRDIIENLRTYTKKIEPNLIRLPFKNFFENSKRFILEQNKDILSNISFNYKVSEDASVNVDKKAMEQVFNNLIKNAIEASDKKSLKINLIAETDEQNCKLIFQDNGKGFDSESEQIFEPMFTTKAQGTGLGLVICQAIIEGHHGHLKAESHAEEGITSFSIFLPKYKEKE